MKVSSRGVSFSGLLPWSFVHDCFTPRTLALAPRIHDVAGVHTELWIAPAEFLSQRPSCIGQWRTVAGKAMPVRPQPCGMVAKVTAVCELMVAIAAAGHGE
jgi:hypothetical protein